MKRDEKAASVTFEVATQCADGEQIASRYSDVPYPLDQADKYCACGGPHWIGKRTVTYGEWERVEPEPTAKTDSEPAS